MIKNFLSTLLAIVCFAPNQAWAEDNMLFRLGQGFNKVTQSRAFSLTYNGYFEENIFYLVEVGLWTDQDSAHRPSVWWAGGVGHRFGSMDSINGQVTLSVLLMPKGDVVLAAPFQFTETVSLGYKGIALGLRHISNAGIQLPNLGRDYYFIEFTIPLRNVK